MTPTKPVYELWNVCQHQNMTAANGVLVSDSNVDLKDHGIDTLGATEAKTYFLNASPSVIGLHIEPSTFQLFWELARSLSADFKKRQFLLIANHLQAEQICRLISLLRPHKVLQDITIPKLALAFQETFQLHYELGQTEKLAELVGEKNDELKRLSVELEEKVQVRQKLLESSILKNTNAEKRLHVLKKTIIHIYQAQSLAEISHGIKEALKSEFDIINVLIRQRHQSNLKDQKGIHQISVSLKSGKRDYGFLIFQSQRQSAFSKDEKKFFSQIAESVALSIEKSFQIQKEHDLSLQWEATFDAISDPVCLTDSQYNILRTNKAFQTKTGHQNAIYGKKCHKILFQRDTVCEGCQRGAPFQLKAKSLQNEVYEVHSNPVQDAQGVTYFQIYRDITQSLNLERQVIESAKMAEIGTISSSIAHELNNPIGGMLNFLQLMQMDLNGDEPYFSDIVEIEKGTQKCKTIVQNLLGFSRKSGVHSKEKINIVEVVEQAIKITELKTRSIGISIHKKYEVDKAPIEGWFNLLAHAFRNILQNSQESILEKRQKLTNYKGHIEVDLTETSKAFQITFSDDGIGLNASLIPRLFDPLFTTKDPTTNSGLGLTLVQQIVQEHKGSVSVTSNKDKKIVVTILLDKAEVES